MTAAELVAEGKAGVTVPKHEIACQDCGFPYRTTRANTKYCAVCRLLKDVLYLGVRTGECLNCSERFCKLSRHDQLCGVCDPTVSSLYGKGHCALCDTDQAILVRQDVAVCLPCARSATERRRFIKALLRKVADRKEQTHG